MGSQHLSERANWQNETSIRSYETELNTYEKLKEYFSNNPSVVLKGGKKKPKVCIGTTFVKPEILITNHSTGKSVVVDDKRGDNGGNAHERGAKYFTRKTYKYLQDSNITPILVFSGRTFAEEGSYVGKNGQSINAALNREKLKDHYNDDEYFIVNLDGSNYYELGRKIEDMIS